MVWFFEMPFGFDNVAYPWQVFKLSIPPPFGHLSPLALYNHKYQRHTVLYPGYSFKKQNKL